jgi:putative FmdB family regulatory protein
MPTYEFRCPKGHEFEKFYRSIGTAPSEVHCPECGMLAERQLSGGAGLVFKGSGFYITDYGKDGKKDQTKAPVTAASGSSEKSDSGSATTESGSGATGESKSSESKSTDSKSADSKSRAGSDAKSSTGGEKSSVKSGDSKPSGSSSKKKDPK